MKLLIIKFKDAIFLQNLYWISSVILSVVIVSSVAIGTYFTFQEDHEEVFMEIPVAVQAVVEANYSDGVEEYAFPGVELSIVKEVISDAAANQSDKEELEERVLQVVELLQRPVPLATNPPEGNEGVIVNLIPTPTNSNPFLQTTNTLAISQTATISISFGTTTRTAPSSLTATQPLIPVTGTSTRTFRPGNTSTFTFTPSMPTQIFSSTLTSSVTPFLTYTPSFTATNTLIPSLTPSLMPTYPLTPSLTSISTQTFTPSLTSSVTPSLTDTPKFTSTNTLTPSLTPSLTPTFKFTPSLTTSPTQTYTPSLTSSVTPSLTYTPTFTSTNTLTPSLTPSLTPTFTLTPSLTSTPILTFTFTPTLTNSLTPTFTSTKTLIPSLTPTFTFTPTLTRSLTPSLTSTLTPTLTLTPITLTPPTQTPSATPTNVVCNNDPNLELLGYFWPSNGSVNIPVNVYPVIFFNQSMDPTTLTYGDENHVVICQKTNANSNACRNGTAVNASIEIRSLIYRNNLVVIIPQEPLQKGVLYTLFAGNQIKVNSQCLSTPMNGRKQSNFTTILE